MMAAIGGHGRRSAERCVVLKGWAIECGWSDRRPKRKVPFINVNAIARGCRIAAVAAAFAAAPLLLSGVSHADPDPDPPPPVDLQAECESANIQGAFSSTTSPDGVSHGVCTYIEDGYFYYDNYDNGVYTGTLVNRNGETVPAERPQLAPLVPLPRGFPLVPFPGGF
jgi:hypothetical protein